MKGYAITLDAVIALSFFMFAMAIITSQSYPPSAPSGAYLKQLSLDIMTIVEKTGEVDQALAGNATSMQETLEAMPISACMGISIFNAIGDMVVMVQKSGCDENAGTDIQIIAKPVFYQGDRYIVKSESWFKKEPDE